MTQKELFLKYLVQMDLDMLDIVLSDDITYFGATKEVFLEKLAYIFEQSRLAVASGDFSGDLRIKFHKKHKNTCYLLLPFVSFFIKFIIEEDNGKILKIYDNRVIRNKDEADGIGSVEMYFGEDERADFKPDTDYVMNLYRCNKIYDEITQDKSLIMTMQDLNHWLEEHAPFYHEIEKKFLYFKYNNFRNLYFLLEFMAEQLYCHKQAALAVEDFYKLDPKSPSFFDESNKWRENNNVLAYCDCYNFDFGFEIVNKTRNIVKLIHNPKLTFQGKEFMSCIVFNRIFNHDFENL